MTLKADYLLLSIKAGEKVTAIIEQVRQQIMDQSNVASLTVAVDCVKPANAATAISDDMEVYVEGVINVEAELKRLAKQKEETEKFIKGAEAKLGNENFVNRARPEVVQRERDRLKQLKEQLATIEKNLADLG